MKNLNRRDALRASVAGLGAGIASPLLLTGQESQASEGSVQELSEASSIEAERTEKGEYLANSRLPFLVQEFWSNRVASTRLRTAELYMTTGLIPKFYSWLHIEGEDGPDRSLLYFTGLTFHSEHRDEYRCPEIRSLRERRRLLLEVEEARPGSRHRLYEAVRSSAESGTEVTLQPPPDSEESLSRHGARGRERFKFRIGAKGLKVLRAEVDHFSGQPHLYDVTDAFLNRETDENRPLLLLLDSDLGPKVWEQGNPESIGLPENFFDNLGGIGKTFKSGFLRQALAMAGYRPCNNMSPDSACKIPASCRLYDLLAMVNPDYEEPAQIACAVKGILEGLELSIRSTLTLRPFYTVDGLSKLNRRTPAALSEILRMFQEIPRGVSGEYIRFTFNSAFRLNIDCGVWSEVRSPLPPDVASALNALSADLVNGAVSRTVLASDRLHDRTCLTYDTVKKMLDRDLMILDQIGMRAYDSFLCEKLEKLKGDPRANKLRESIELSSAAALDQDAIPMGLVTELREMSALDPVPDIELGLRISRANTRTFEQSVAKSLQDLTRSAVAVSKMVSRHLYTQSLLFS